ncbi:MAG: hypothetical protein HZB59_02435 [Ignavibacteriales bacterium]|nr:hypothetical protein [Ignavibacteriales bacterium]
MTKRLIYVTILQICLLTITQAQNDTLSHDEPSYPFIDAFISANLNFEEEWMTTDYHHHPRIDTTNVAHVGQMVNAGFIVANLSLSRDSIRHYRIDISVEGPDGKEVYRNDEFLDSKKHVSSNFGYILADRAFTIMPEIGDPLGKYKIRAVLHDLIAGTQAEDICELNIIP